MVSPRRPAPNPPLTPAPTRSAAPPPSPALSTSSADGFSAYSALDSPSESASFHFSKEHGLESPSLSSQGEHAFDDPPLSPQSFREAHSEYSPSPSASLASVRTAKIAVLKPTTRGVMSDELDEEGGRAATRREEEPEDTGGVAAFDRALGLDTTNVSRVLNTPGITSAPPAVPLKASERPRVPTAGSASGESTASSSSSAWRTDEKIPLPVEADPSVRPDKDAMTRMKSILGRHFIPLCVSFCLD